MRHGYDLMELLVNLTERPTFPEKGGGSDKGHIPVVSMADISHSLGKLAAKHPESALLLRVKYSYAHGARYNEGNRFYSKLVCDLDRKLWLKICDMAWDGKWVLPEKRGVQLFLRSLGQMAIAEHISPHNCIFCGGTNKAVEKNLLVDCKHCNNEGKKVIRPSDRAEVLGLSQSEWREWEPRYSRIQDILKTWEGNGQKEFLKKFFGKG